MSYKGYVKDENEYDLLCRVLRNETIDFITDRKKKLRLKKKALNYFMIINEMLYQRDRGSSNHRKVFHLEQHEAMRQEVVNFHATNHYGQNKMDDLCDKLYFTIPRSIIRDVVSNCVTCAQSQSLKQKNVPKHVIASSVFERLQMDLVDLRMYKEENDGYAWLCNIIDVFSRFAFSIPLKNKTAQCVEVAFQDLIFKYGAPKFLQTDNGTEFKNTCINDLCNQYNIRMIHGRPRHPQSQGIVERLNQTISRYLQKNLYDETTGQVRNKRWIDILSRLVYQYNISIHSSHQKSPFEIFYQRSGFNTVMNEIRSEDLLEESKDEVDRVDLPLSLVSNSQDIKSDCQMLRSRERYYERMDRYTHMENVTFEAGDRFLIAIDFDNNTKTRKNKFDSFYMKQYTVKTVLNQFIIYDDGDTEKRICPTRIKKV